MSIPCHNAAQDVLYDIAIGHHLSRPFVARAFQHLWNKPQSCTRWAKFNLKTCVIEIRLACSNKLVNGQRTVLRASTAKFINMFSRQMSRKRFSHNHIDCAGPIPNPKSSTFVFITIDLTNMWLSALSTTDSLTPDCATALVRHWKNGTSYLHK